VAAEDHIKDLKLIDEMLVSARSRVRNEIATIREKQRQRARKPRDVSDHAVVRYLERTGRIDIDAIRQEINALADEAVPFAKADGVWHAGAGMVFITNGSSVVTVLSEEQSEKYIGRDLATGDEAQRIAGNDATRKTPTTFPCNACTQTFDSMRLLKAHVLAVHIVTATDP